MFTEVRYGFPRLMVSLVVLALLAVPLAACEKDISISTQDHLNTRKAEREISKSASKQVGEHVTVKCPAKVKLELGLETICRGTDAHGRTQRIRMRQTDSTGHTTWTLIRDLDTLKLEPGIIRIGTNKGFAITDASCPVDIEIVAGTKFTCKVTVDGQQRTLPAVESDDQGNIEFNWSALT